MFCRNCGQKLSDNEKYCPKCGTVLIVKKIKYGKYLALFGFITGLIVMFLGYKWKESKYYLSEETTDTVLAEYLDSEIVDDWDNETKAHRIIEYLTMLSENNPGRGDAYVAKDSVFYDSYTECIYFEEAKGTSCGISLADVQDGTTSGSANAEDFSDADEVISAETKKEILVVSEVKETAQKSLEYYEPLADLIEADFNTKVDIELGTLAFFRKGLLGYKYIAIECHGLLYKINGEYVPVVESYNTVKNLKNSEQLNKDKKEKRIYKILVTHNGENEKWTYFMAPKFFEYYYRNTKLDADVVHIGSCCGFGNNEEYQNHSLSDAFLNIGASAVLGHTNKVYTDYDFSILHGVLENMLNGITIENALELAKETYGENDVVYMREYGTEKGKQDSYNHVPARSYIHGNKSTVLNIEKKILVTTKIEDNDMTGQPLVSLGYQHGENIYYLSCGNTERNLSKFDNNKNKTILFQEKGLGEYLIGQGENLYFVKDNQILRLDLNTEIYETVCEVTAPGDQRITFELCGLANNVLYYSYNIWGSTPELYAYDLENEEVRQITDIEGFYSSYGKYYVYDEDFCIYADESMDNRQACFTVNLKTGGMERAGLQPWCYEDGILYTSAEDEGGYYSNGVHAKDMNLGAEGLFEDVGCILDAGDEHLLFYNYYSGELCQFHKADRIQDIIEMNYLEGTWQLPSFNHWAIYTGYEKGCYCVNNQDGTIYYISDYEVNYPAVVGNWIVFFDGTDEVMLDLSYYKVVS